VEGGCHDAGNPRVALVAYAGIMNGIQEGNAEGSWFYHAIGHGMPPLAEPQMSPEQLAVINQWIQEGAKNSNCDDVDCDSTNVAYTGNVEKILADNCNGCHNSTVYPNARQFSSLDFARSVIAGDPERFLRSIRYAAGPQANMPPSFKMNVCDRQKLEAWVNKGMPK
jgi:uncharacterized membrane protein